MTTAVYLLMAFDADKPRDFSLFPFSFGAFSSLADLKLLNLQ
jgi:hypothetical protein